MPVHVRRVGDEYRIVDPNGKITRNSKGTAVDGGGHGSKKAAEKQAAAINIHTHEKGKA